MANCSAEHSRPVFANQRGNGLNAISPFVLAPFAADLEDDKALANDEFNQFLNEVFVNGVASRCVPSSYMASLAGKPKVK